MCFKSPEQQIFSSQKRSDPLWARSRLQLNWWRVLIPSGVKQTEHEADRLPPSSAKVKNEWSDMSTAHHTLSFYTQVYFIFTEIHFAVCEIHVVKLEMYES